MSTKKHLLASTFTSFRDHLDHQNDRRERLIKVSRDVTILSKKIVFLLHRILTEEWLDTPAIALAAQRARPKFQQVQVLFFRLKDDLQGDQFRKQISPGLQEYIEALGFAHYLEYGTLISLAQVQSSLSDEAGVPYFPLPVSDYLLGLSDVTGELMRFAISGISLKGGPKRAHDICTFVRGCKSDFACLAPFDHELQKKQAVTTQSLEKIEDAVYSIVLKSSEYNMPTGITDEIMSHLSWIPDVTAPSSNLDDDLANG